VRGHVEQLHQASAREHHRAAWLRVTDLAFAVIGWFLILLLLPFGLSAHLLTYGLLAILGGLWFAYCKRRAHKGDIVTPAPRAAPDGRELGSGRICIAALVYLGASGASPWPL